MKSQKKLQALFEKAKNNKLYNTYIDFNSFMLSVKDFKTAMIKNNGRTTCSINVSRSGMTRTFNFSGNLNLLFNVILKEKISYEPFKIGGCGMDMHWYSKFRVCENIFTKKEIEKYNLNYRCSSGEIL